MFLPTNALREDMTAEEVIGLLDLAPHPEGGHYRETFRDPRTDADGRALSTAIYFLLAEGEVSAWHRVDATEIWHWYGGAPLLLHIADEAGQGTIPLGGNLKLDQQPQGIVPANAWQSAETTGRWTLAGCTVAPGFEFKGFELAPPGWQPG